MTKRKIVTMNNSEFPIPDILLRDAYLAVAKKVGMYREKFAARTENIEAVKLHLGPAYAHHPNDDIRDRIITCAKAPNSHGGGWAVTGNGHGPKKGHKQNRKLKVSKKLQDHYTSIEYAQVKDILRDTHDGQCVACGKPLEEFHHCRYDRIGTLDEIRDVVPVCNVCHPILDRLRRNATK